MGIGIQAQKEKERMALMERMRGELGDEFEQEEWEIQHFVAAFLLPAVDKELSQKDGTLSFIFFPSL